MAVSPTVVPSGTSAPLNTLQYKRNFRLLVSGSNFNGLDLSALRCKFSIKRSSNQTPNCADITIYNVSEDTALLIQKQFTNVILQGGYDSNYGVVFQGTIKQVIVGRESATDTFITLNCGDGDLAYNFAVVNTTIKKGSSQSDQFAQVAAPMKAHGVTQAPASTQPAFNTVILPRGKVLWGNAKDYMRTLAKQNGLTWSIQNEQVGFIHQQGYSPGQTIVLTSKTGMIGTPQQTNIGVNVVALMNPNINPGRTIQINARRITL